MYKLVAIDLDGTMLNSYGTVTEHTKQVIKDTIQKGTEVVIASGRPIDSIKAIAEEIGSKKYLIAGNGALIYDIQKEQIIYDKFLPKQKVLEIIKICEENSIAYNIYTEQTVLATALKYNVLYYQKENLKKEESKQTKISIIKDMYDYVKNKQDDKFLKVTICDDIQTVFQSILRKLRKIEGIEVMDASHMSRKTIQQGTEEITVEYYYAEISMQNVDKWYAIEHLMQIMNLQKEEVMTIGDNINDKKMIEEAGLGVIMAGSTPEVSRDCRLYYNFQQRRWRSKRFREILLNANVTKILQQY